MFNLLSFVSPLEFLLRYTVIFGILFAVAGFVVIVLAKPITLKKKNMSVLNKNDKFYLTLLIVGLGLIMLGMIIMALPISATLYKG